MKSKWINEKENLKKLIFEEHKSYESIGRLYNCSGSNIKKVSRKLGIYLPKKRQINPNETFNKGRKLKTYNCKNCGKVIDKKQLFCSKDCFNEFRHKQNYKNFLEHPENYSRANYNLKSFKKDILIEQNYKCSICGCSTEHNKKPLTFVLDHIDGHSSNNHRDNLRLICPNCDSQLDTFKSRNKNSDRSYYRYPRSASRETGNVENPLNDEG
jgi:rubrerythrin